MIPLACPACQGDEFNVTVKAWAIYKAGELQALYPSEEVTPDDLGVAICTACGHEVDL